MSRIEQVQIDGIVYDIGEAIIIDSSMSSTSTNAVQNKVINSALNSKVPTTRTVNGKSLSTNISLTASDVGADASGSASSALSSAKSYSDANLATAKSYTDTAIDDKVDKVSGKGLSTNDYTTAEKNKLSGIDSGAQVNSITGVKGDAESSYRKGNVNITPENIGLGNVANVSTNNQTPTYTTSTSLTALTSGEKLSVAFGKIAKAVSTLISHLGNTTIHIASTERTAWNNAKDKADVTNIACGTCDTAGNIAEKVVTLEGNDNWTLKKGAIIMVKFASANTASNVTLNVNGTGGKQIWYANKVYTGNSAVAGGEQDRYHMYVYDGTYWAWVSHGQDANTTYTNQSLGQGYATCTTSAATTAKVATLSGYGKTLGGIVAVKFTYAVPANATLNINNRGANAIYHNGSAIKAGVIKAGDTATFMYDDSYYQLLTIDKLTASDVGAVSTGGGTFTGQITGENGNGDETWWIDEYGDAGGFNSLNATTLKESGTSLVDKYATKSHTHTKSEITDFPTSMTPTAHNQASNTINAMTGYSKPSSTSSITTSDTLNSAIGKLEKALDGKASTSHTHSESYAPYTVGQPAIKNDVISIQVSQSVGASAVRTYSLGASGTYLVTVIIRSDHKANSGRWFFGISNVGDWHLMTRDEFTASCSVSFSSIVSNSAFELAMLSESSVENITFVVDVSAVRLNS